MYKYLKFIALTVVMAGFSAAILVSPVLAESGEVYCAAVLPCDEDGSVLPAFDQGPCAEMYATQCANLASEQLGEKLSSCEDKRSDLENNIRRLKRQLKQERLKQSK